MSSNFKAVFAWLGEGKHTWLALAVTLAALIICLRPGSSEPLIRLTGLGLQVLGVGTAIWGILQTRKFFGRQPVLGQFKNWISRCPLRRRTLVGAVGTATSHSSAGRLRGYSIAPIDPTAATEARLASVEKNIGLIHERITAVTREVDGDMSAIRSELKMESDTRNMVAAQLHDRLEGVATGGIPASAIGAAWLFVGAILSTAAPELANLLK